MDLQPMAHYLLVMLQQVACSTLWITHYQALASTILLTIQLFAALALQVNLHVGLLMNWTNGGLKQTSNKFAHKSQIGPAPVLLTQLFLTVKANKVGTGSWANTGKTFMDGLQLIQHNKTNYSQPVKVSKDSMQLKVTGKMDYLMHSEISALWTVYNDRM